MEEAGSHGTGILVPLSDPTELIPGGHRRMLVIRARTSVRGSSAQHERAELTWPGIEESA
jgi:hypothetical protein